MRLALRIAYDGTAFYGFQRQPNLRTVEGELLGALRKLGIIADPTSSKFKGASRTDRGVSAFFNVVAFNPTPEREGLATPEVLNHHLRDVWVLGRAQVPDDFHPRFAAGPKTYRYYLVDEGLEAGTMIECAEILEGTHDFSAFARLEPGRNPVRTINSIDLMQRRGYYVIEVTGKSFLWEMVRRIANAIRFCGLGLLKPSKVGEMLSGKYRRKIPPAPPENLVLWGIEYGIQFEASEKALRKVKEGLFSRYSRALVRAALLSDWLTSL